MVDHEEIKNKMMTRYKIERDKYISINYHKICLLEIFSSHEISVEDQTFIELKTSMIHFYSLDKRILSTYVVWGKSR